MDWMSQDTIHMISLGLFKAECMVVAVTAQVKETHQIDYDHEMTLDNHLVFLVVIGKLEGWKFNTHENYKDASHVVPGV